jgi:hypothetical protein
VTLTNAQVAMLQRLATDKRGPSGLVEYVCATTSEFSTVKALARRGLVQWRYLASRLFGAKLTASGRAALGERGYEVLP